MKHETTAVRGGICAPRGFRASGVTCGIKDPNSDKLDLALIWSKFPTVTAAVFTQNEIKAAPVQLSAEYLKKKEPRAIIANSGNANACTGAAGMGNARRMASAVASELKVLQREILVASTGIIGVQMPIERIESKVPELVGKLSKDCRNAAAAIMTSDTRPKTAAIQFRIGGRKIRIGAIAKGAGMINPNMATMLCFVTTDAKISKAELQSATREAVEMSFNRITIDGDMSTNDTVMVMSSQRARNRTITQRGPGSRIFRDALTELLVTMAKKCVADGERVTKLVEVAVVGAASDIDAEKVARAVANSSLVKCSWNGNDPNWGRVIHAVGYSGARIRPEMIDIYFDGRCAAKHGEVADTPVSELRRAVSKKNIRILIDLQIGNGKYHIYTSDLSPEYVRFNREEYAVFRMKRPPAPRPETPPANQISPTPTPDRVVESPVEQPGPPHLEGWIEKPSEEDE